MAQRSGNLTCGICGKRLKQATWVPMFVCVDNNCPNGEEHLYD